MERERERERERDMHVNFINETMAGQGGRVGLKWSFLLSSAF